MKASIRTFIADGDTHEGEAHGRELRQAAGYAPFRAENSSAIPASASALPEPIYWFRPRPIRRRRDDKETQQGEDRGAVDIGFQSIWKLSAVLASAL
jgi:hypothetical protein